jgi:hypothetical protein
MKIWFSGQPARSGHSVCQVLLPVILLVAFLDFGLFAQTKEEARPRPPITPEDLAMTDLPVL